MPLPKLEVGLVVRYEYLWNRRRTAGGADKDHPACIVMTFRRPAEDKGDQLSLPPPDVGEAEWKDYVVYLPISHTPPGEGQVGLELSDQVKRKVGLDHRPQWILLSECNIDLWPEDLRALPRQPGRFQYGVMPPAEFRRIRDAFVALYRERRVATVQRS